MNFNQIHEINNELNLYHNSLTFVLYILINIISLAETPIIMFMNLLFFNVATVDGFMSFVLHCAQFILVLGTGVVTYMNYKNLKIRKKQEEEDTKED